MKGSFLTCETKQGLMDIYVSSPENQKKYPVIIVLQEAFGVNNHIRSVCDRLADHGFLAAAPELFHRQGRRIEIPYGERKLFMPYLSSIKNDEIITDVEDTIKFLSELPTADVSEVNTIGFCVGGFASVLCATRLEVRKMISFYGAGMVNRREGIALDPLLPHLSSIKGKCLFFFGGKDASIPPSDIHAIEEKLSHSNISFEMNVFPESDHGFFCDERKSFNEKDAARAWERSLEFLKDNSP